MDRRDLLRLVAGQRTPPTKPASPSFKRQAARPPQAAIEPLFLRTCDGCGACETACPEKVICMDRGKPTVDFTCGECSMCGRCTEACPGESLQSAIRFDTGMRPFFERGCDIYQKQTCRLCLDRCPSDALITENPALPHSAPSLIDHLCTGCGQCYHICPQKKISLRLQTLS